MVEQLKLMPYNQAKDEEVPDDIEISTDRASDLPNTGWEVPEPLSKVHVYRIAQVWLDWARQNMRLKFMVADIVQRNMKNKCQKCGEKFRLQVI